MAGSEGARCVEARGAGLPKGSEQGLAGQQYAPVIDLCHLRVDAEQQFETEQSAKGKGHFALAMTVGILLLDLHLRAAAAS